MKLLPIEVFLLHLLVNPPQELQPKDQELSESNKSQFLDFFLNETQFSLANSFGHQGPVVIMAAERRHSTSQSPSRHCELSDENRRIISRPDSPYEIPVESSDEIQTHENVVTQSSTIIHNDELTTQDCDKIETDQDDEIAWELFNFTSLDFSEKPENWEFELEQYKENDSWGDELYQPKKEAPPTFLSKTFSIDLVEPSLRENVLDMEFLNSLRNYSAERQSEICKNVSEPREDSKTISKHSNYNFCFKNENNTCELSHGNIARSFLQDETSSYCNSVAAASSSSLECIKKEEYPVDDYPDSVRVSGVTGVSNLDGTECNDVDVFSLEPTLWDSENIENMQQVSSHSQLSVDLHLGTALNTNGILSNGSVFTHFPPILEEPCSPSSSLGHNCGEEAVSTEQLSMHGSQGISPSLMTFDHSNSELLRVPESSSAAGNPVYRDQDFLHEIGVAWTSEQVTHASLEDFNRLVATVTIPSHVEALRGIRKRGKNKLAARRVRSKTHLELEKVRNQIAVFRQRRDELKERRDLLLQQLNSRNRSLMSRQSATYGRNSDGRVEAYTDGACKNNNTYSGRSAGVGVNFPQNRDWNISRPLASNPCTNQRAELEAVNDAMKTARHQGVPKLTVYSDSKYVVDGANDWSRNWEQNGYKTSSGGEVKNQDLWREMQDHRQHVDVKFEHVPGHRGNLNNEKADRLANQGAGKSY